MCDVASVASVALRCEAPSPTRRWGVELEPQGEGELDVVGQSRSVKQGIPVVFTRFTHSHVMPRFVFMRRRMNFLKMAWICSDTTCLNSKHPQQKHVVFRIQEVEQKTSVDSPTCR